MIKSILLTAIQFICIGWILYTNPWLSENRILMVVQLIGLMLGIWAIAKMSKSKLNVTPTPVKGAMLITSGPYHWVRHPMYTALILMLFPILYNNYGQMNLIIFGILFINLILKINYEEHLLRKRFQEYHKMESTTWRLLPWVY